MPSLSRQHVDGWFTAAYFCAHLIQWVDVTLSCPLAQRPKRRASPFRVLQFARKRLRTHRANMSPNERRNMLFPIK